MKILAADGLDKKAVVALQGDGHEVEIGKGGYDAAALADALAGVDVLVVRSATKVPREALEAGKKDALKLVIRAGSGLDSIDTAAADELGVRVTNTPGLNAPAVAELAIGLMFAVARRIGYAHAGMVAGRWEKKVCKGFELGGKRLAVIGLGPIGSQVARMGKALGMDVVGARQSMIPKSGDPPLITIPEMFETCDIVSVHVPKSPSTANLVSRKLIERCKKGLVLINTARGDVVDLDACFDGLESGRLGGLGVDVYPVEPPEKPHPVLAHPNVVATPHVGAQTVESGTRIGERIVELVSEM